MKLHETWHMYNRKERERERERDRDRDRDRDRETDKVMCKNERRALVFNSDPLVINHCPIEAILLKRICKESRPSKAWKYEMIGEPL